MNRHNLLEKRYIVRLLGLILTSENGEISNASLSRKLNKSPSTIYPQLSYLEKKRLIYKEKIKESSKNEKVYRVEGRLGRLFVDFLEKKTEIKNIKKFKDNIGIDLTICIIISGKLKHEKVKEITLTNIFLDAYEFLLKVSIIKDISKVYKFHNKKDEVEFKEFLRPLKVISMKILKEEKEKAEAERKRKREEEEAQKQIERTVQKLQFKK